MMDFMRSHQFDMLIFIIAHLNQGTWFFVSWDLFLFFWIPGFLILAIFNHIIALKLALPTDPTLTIFQELQGCALSLLRACLWCVAHRFSSLLPFLWMLLDEGSGTVARQNTVAWGLDQRQEGWIPGHISQQQTCFASQPDMSRRSLTGSPNTSFKMASAWKMLACWKHRSYGRWSNVTNPMSWNYHLLKCCPIRWSTPLLSMGFQRYSLLIAALCHDMGHFGKWKPQIGTVGVGH